jgi:hypothetical protein
LQQRLEDDVTHVDDARPQPSHLMMEMMR